jgi:hypothetical protein
MSFKNEEKFWKENLNVGKHLNASKKAHSLEVIKNNPLRNKEPNNGSYSTKFKRIERI